MSRGGCDAYPFPLKFRLRLDWLQARELAILRLKFLIPEYIFSVSILKKTFLAPRTSYQDPLKSRICGQ